MFDSDKTENERLDRGGRMVLRAAAANEAEIGAAAAAPFLFTRVRAAIAAEQRRREETSSWLSIFFVARQAVPAMALIALLASILTVWCAQLGASTLPLLDDEALFGGAGVERTVLADRNDLPADEVLNIVVDRDYERGAR